MIKKKTKVAVSNLQRRNFRNPYQKISSVTTYYGTIHFFEPATKRQTNLYEFLAAPFKMDLGLENT